MPKFLPDDLTRSLDRLISSINQHQTDEDALLRVSNQYPQKTVEIQQAHADLSIANFFSYLNQNDFHVGQAPVDASRRMALQRLMNIRDQM